MENTQYANERADVQEISRKLNLAYQDLGMIVYFGLGDDRVSRCVEKIADLRDYYEGAKSKSSWF